MIVTLQIHRFVEDKKWIQEYNLEIKKGMTILEGFHEIKAKQDATLSFTSSCRSSICGACAVRVNDNAELACEVLLEDLMKRYKTNTLVVKPLGNFRVIRDLIVDWDPKYTKMKTIDPVVNPKKEFSAEKGCKQSIADFNKYKKYAGCILCGSCVSECNKNELNQKDFLDPFIFVKAAKITLDSRERSPEEHLRAVVQAGLWKCFNCQECTAKCPKDLDPAGAIEKLKAASIALAGDGSVGANHAKAIYKDIYNKGLLDESKLAVQSEGVFAAAMRVPVAYRLMKTGKLNLMEKVPENKEIHQIRQIIDIAEKEDK